MAYEIYIGEWNRGATADEEGCTPQDVSLIEIDGAPTCAGDEMTGCSNRRQPSYGVWDRFCRATGVYALFFDPRKGLMREHPGTASLTKGHAKEIAAALARYRANHPDAQPTFESADEHDHHLARLIWLDWWVRWALANCRQPAIHNR